MKRAVSGLLAAAGVLVLGSPASSQSAMKRGEYLATIMDCGGCHTTGIFLGKPDPKMYLAGSEVGFQIPGLGIFYPPNLTPDPETGLGKWSEADIIKALRTGIRPDGRELAPAMPWRSYAKASDADMKALVAFLRSLKPVQHQTPAIKGPTEKPSDPYLTVVMP
jgi:mono/diheme cytochrome c family protein